MHAFIWYSGQGANRGTPWVFEEDGKRPVYVSHFGLLGCTAKGAIHRDRHVLSVTYTRATWTGRWVSLSCDG